MKTKLRILNITLILLMLFFESAVLSGMVRLFYYPLSWKRHLCYFLLYDVANTTFVVGLLLIQRGLWNYMKKERFDDYQWRSFRRAGIILLCYAIFSIVRLAAEKLYFVKKFYEVNWQQIQHYSTTLIIGIFLLIIAGFIKKAVHLQEENDLTL